MDPLYVKGYLRKGKLLMNSNLIESVNCFSKGLMMEPENKDLKDLKQESLDKINVLVKKLIRYKFILKFFKKF